MKLTVFAIKAAFHALHGIQVKGRVETRLHSRIIRTLEKECTIDGKGEQAQEAEIKLEDAQEHYLKKIVYEQVDKGIQGNMVVGYQELIEALE